MRLPSLLSFWTCLLLLTLGALTPAAAAPQAGPEPLGLAATDWLLEPAPYTAEIARSQSELVLTNGLVSRAWRLTPAAACVALDEHMSGQSLLRSVRPEARVTLDGVAFDVGGLAGQPNHAYLQPGWLDGMTAIPRAFEMVGLELGTPRPSLTWKRVRHTAPDVQWPPRGKRVKLSFKLNRAYLDPTGEGPDSRDPRWGAWSGVKVEVYYELYDGVPVFAKWVELTNGSDTTVVLDRIRTEELAVVEQVSWVEDRGLSWPEPDALQVITDYSFGGMTPQNANRHVVHWRTDPLYSSQVNYLRNTPCLLVCEPTYGPAQAIEPGGRFQSYRTYELVHAGGDRERRGLAYRRMLRTIAPWVTENPLTHHLLTNDPDQARAAIDQAAEVGFEAIIFSFGSGFDMENLSPEHVATWREVADYARSKGVELGSYSLLSSRFVGDEHMLTPPEGQSATHGRMPALTSAWGQEWLDKMQRWYAETGFAHFENDGPYPGDIDVTPRMPLQQGEQDSRWVQWRLNGELYKGLRAAGVYINQPDYHFLVGGNKTSMGYREVNWSLPRAEQVIHTRQNIYDGTWLKTPSMGWMHVPLAQYHGGGAAATIEPLHEHRDHYRRMLLSNLGLGVQAHYRGPRLFDTPETREVVRGAVDWFKQYRDILESDVIHGRRADGRDLDWMLHVNPQLEHRGMLCVYNPLDRDVARTLRVDLYYTGLRDSALVQAGAEGAPQRVELTRGTELTLDVSVPAGEMAWVLITE
ncbi:MAG: alpha-galactosidase [Planctomycetota bacterium]|jgi:hypothetical protein